MNARWIEIKGEVLATPADRPWSSPGDEPPAVTSPGLGRSCLLYRVELTALQRLIEASASPCRERAGRRFVVQTVDRQRWVVDPSRARLCWAALSVSLVAGVGQGELDKRLRQLYQRLGRSFRRRRVIRLREWRVEVGDQLRVSAWLQRVPSPDGEAPGYRQAPTTLLLSAISLSRC